VTDVFSGIIGHTRAVALLRREAAAPANAYLFTGVAGVGKTTVARAFAKLLLCPESVRHEEPCRSCRRVDSGNHPDLTVIRPEGRQSLGVEQARTTVQQAVMSPVEGERKVFLFEEASNVTEQAANALLKTLEEPTASTVFILVAESEDHLPSTVASRCRTVHFGRVGDSDIRAAMESLGVDTERASALAAMTGGRPGLALALISTPDIGKFRAGWLSVPHRVTDRPGESFLLAQEMLAAADPLVDRAVAESPDQSSDQLDRAKRRARSALMMSGLEILATWYGDAAAVQYGGPIRNTDVAVSSLTVVSPAQAVRNAELVLDAVADLQANLRPQLLLANLFTELGSVE
jgi:DNA polymerase-3 subunit delta'